MSDDEVERLRDDLCAIAEIAMDQWQHRSSLKMPETEAHPRVQALSGTSAILEPTGRHGMQPPSHEYSGSTLTA